MRRVVMLLVTAWGASGCASGPPTAEELATADYGATISQGDAETRARKWLASYLKDPVSAQCEWQPVQTGWIRTSAFEGGRLMFGYSLNGSINAKNSFGGYVGFRPFSFLFQNGELAAVLGPLDVQGGTVTTTLFVR